MKTKLIVLTAALLLCSLASGQIVMDRNGSNYDPFTVDFTTDKYSYKFEGRWLYKSSTTHFEIVLARYTFDHTTHKTDRTCGWIKYIKNGAVINDDIQNHTFRFSNGQINDPVMTVKYFTDDEKKVVGDPCSSGVTTSEYVLKLMITDRANRRRYIGTMTMDPTNRDKATMKIADDVQYRKSIDIYIVGSGDEPNPDTTVYFPTSLTLTRQP